MNKHILLIMTLALSACAPNNKSVETHQQTARIDPIKVNKEHQSTTALEEYVNRINKRLEIVSNRPYNNYFFVVVDSAQMTLSFDQAKQKIYISRGILDRLKDEAELAATLNLIVAKYSGETNPDRETAATLYRAGYDPVAMLELQEEYFHAAHSGEDHWLKVIYSSPPTASTITANKLMISKMQQGLLREQEDYQKQVDG